MKSTTTFTSDISKKEFPIADKISAKTIRNPILALIQNDYPDFDEDKFLSIGELNMYREKYISNFPAMVIVYMCMLFPNTSIGMINQILVPPTRKTAT